MLRVLQIRAELLRPVDLHDHQDIRVGITRGAAADDLGVMQKRQLRFQRGIDRFALRKDGIGIRAGLQLQEIVMGHVFRLLFLISHKIPRGIPLVKCPKCGIAERFGVKCSGKNHFSDFKLCIDKESCDFRRKNFFNVFCACSGPLSRRLVDFSDGFCYSESSSTRIRYQLT